MVRNGGVELFINSMVSYALRAELLLRARALGRDFARETVEPS
jgi:hypothetical protein